jgi:mRNA interferase RelE/StbE
VTYRVEILRRAVKSLKKLPTPEYERVRDAVRSLGEEPRPAGCRKLIGRDGWRIRVGQYRVVYEIEDVIRIVTVLDLGHRKDIYD